MVIWLLETDAMLREQGHLTDLIFHVIDVCTYIGKGIVQSGKPSGFIHTAISSGIV